MAYVHGEDVKTFSMFMIKYNLNVITKIHLSMIFLGYSNYITDSYIL